MFKEVKTIGERSGLLINPRKSGVMIIPGRDGTSSQHTSDRQKALWRSKYLRSGEELKVNGTPIIRTPTYMYLGVPMAENLIRSRALALEKAQMACTHAGFSCGAVFSGAWLGVKLKNQIGRAIVTSSADYVLCTQANSLLIPLRQVDRGVSKALSKSLLCTQSSLMRPHSAATLALCGIKPAHIRSTQLRVNLFRKMLARLHDRSPLAKSLLLTIPQAIDMLPPSISTAFVVQSTVQLQHHQAKQTPLPWALFGILDLWMYGCLPDLNDLKDACLAEGSRKQQALTAVL